MKQADMLQKSLTNSLALIFKFIIVILAMLVMKKSVYTRIYDGRN